MQQNVELAKIPLPAPAPTYAGRSTSSAPRFREEKLARWGDYAERAAAFEALDVKK